MISLLLLFAAFLLFVLAALGATARITEGRLVAAGLACWAFSTIMAGH